MYIVLNRTTKINNDFCFGTEAHSGIARLAPNTQISENRHKHEKETHFSNGTSAYLYR
ncbi:MAG: hypothetical protein QG629_404 [Patescibacteria group bacterium]|nr:hypothetical protein [Patescibacteria group bacterium]